MADTTTTRMINTFPLHFSRSFHGTQRRLFMFYFSTVCRESFLHSAEKLKISRSPLCVRASSTDEYLQWHSRLFFPSSSSSLFFFFYDSPCSLASSHHRFGCANGTRKIEWRKRRERERESREFSRLEQVVDWLEPSSRALLLAIFLPRCCCWPLFSHNRALHCAYDPSPAPPYSFPGSTFSSVSRSSSSSTSCLSFHFPLWMISKTRHSTSQKPSFFPFDPLERENKLK